MNASMDGHRQPQTGKTGVISHDELGNHKGLDSLWLAVHGQVYDLTTFASDHPGGIDVLMDSGGGDATEPFEYAGHTDDAIATMQKFRLGRLEGSADGDNGDDAGLEQGQAKKTEVRNDNKIVADGKAKAKTMLGFGDKLGIPSSSLFAVPIIAIALLLFSTRFIHDSDPSHSLLSTLSLPLSSTLQHLRPAVLFAGDEHSPALAFLGGLLIASAITVLATSILFFFLYDQFSKSLKHGRDVFDYPSVIQRLR